MTRKEYQRARDALGWTHQQMADILGVSRRTPYRYQGGDVEVPEPSARLIRLLVAMRKRLPERKFEEVIGVLQ